MIKQGSITILALVLSLWATPAWSKGVNSYIYYDSAKQDAQTVTAQLILENLEGLRAFEVKLTFDPAQVQVMDANPAMDGVQVGMGELFQDALVAVNKVDNTRGEILVAAAKPSAEVTGNTDAIKFQLKGVTPGDGKITIPKDGLKLIDKELKEKIVQVQEGNSRKPLLRANVVKLGAVSPEESTQLKGESVPTTAAGEQPADAQESGAKGQSEVKGQTEAKSEPEAEGQPEVQTDKELDQNQTGKLVTIAGAVLLAALVGYQLYRRHRRRKRRRRI